MRRAAHTHIVFRRKNGRLYNLGYTKSAYIRGLLPAIIPSRSCEQRSYVFGLRREREREREREKERKRETERERERERERRRERSREKERRGRKHK